jgi:hypothetical protein
VLGLSQEYLKRPLEPRTRLIQAPIGHPTSTNRGAHEQARGTTSKKHTKGYKNIDILYADIVEPALEDEDLEPWEIENVKITLHTIICAREPMTAEVLGGLVGLGHERLVLSALKSLLSVLYISPDGGVISAFHASFTDYMLSVERSGRFFYNKAQHHQLLACRCFEVMKDSLRFNICNLESSYAFDDDVPNPTARVNNAVSPRLFYACRYWADHLELAEPPDRLCSLLSEFISTQLLFWIEVLNLKRLISMGVKILFNAYVWSTVSALYLPMYGKVTEPSTHRNLVYRSTSVNPS